MFHIALSLFPSSIQHGAMDLCVRLSIYQFESGGLLMGLALRILAACLCAGATVAVYLIFTSIARSFDSKTLILHKTLTCAYSIVILRCALLVFRKSTGVADKGCHGN